MTVYVMTFILFISLLLPDPYGKAAAVAALIVFGLRVPDHLERLFRRRRKQRQDSDKVPCECGQEMVCIDDNLCRHCKLERSFRGDSR